LCVADPDFEKKNKNVEIVLTVFYDKEYVDLFFKRVCNFG
jgi:hypothetical protein